MTFYVVGFVECENCLESEELISGAEPARFEDGILTTMKSLGDAAVKAGYKYINFLDANGAIDDGWVCPECQEDLREGNKLLS